MNCYKKLFDKEGILNNIGFYLILIIILFHIITFLIFIIKLFPLIKERIKKIVNEFQAEIENEKEEKNNELKNVQLDNNGIYINLQKKENMKKKEKKIQSIIMIYAILQPLKKEQIYH